MRGIPREAGKVTYSTEIRNLKKIGLSEYQRAIVIGLILGDGCLCENWSKTNYRLLMMHSVDQKEYVLWKYSIFKQWILSEPRFYEGNRSLTIRTISHPELTALRSVFYRGKKKIIPENIESLLKDPITLAVWFMDDGNARKELDGSVNGFNLNTQSFSLEENKILAQALFTLYGLVCSVQKNNGYYRLYIFSQSKDRFRKIIDQFIIPSMKYKLG